MACISAESMLLLVAEEKSGRVDAPHGVFPESLHIRVLGVRRKSPQYFFIDFLRFADAIFGLPDFGIGLQAQIQGRCFVGDADLHSEFVHGSEPVGGIDPGDVASFVEFVGEMASGTSVEKIADILRRPRWHD